MSILSAKDSDCIQKYLQTKTSKTSQVTIQSYKKILEEFHSSMEKNKSIEISKIEDSDLTELMYAKFMPKLKNI